MLGGRRGLKGVRVGKRALRLRYFHCKGRRSYGGGRSSEGRGGLVIERGTRRCAVSVRITSVPTFESPGFPGLFRGTEVDGRSRTFGGHCHSSDRRGLSRRVEPVGVDNLRKRRDTKPRSGISWTPTGEGPHGDDI